MLKIPNYNVVVPTTPDLTLYMKPRNPLVYYGIPRSPNWVVPPQPVPSNTPVMLDRGDRNHDIFEITVTDATTIELPWMPTAPNWVEVYNDDVRIVNPRIKGITGGDLFEVFNVTDNLITFNSPVTGNLKVICDSSATHFWGSLILNAKNVQGFYIYTDVHYIDLFDWPITSGTAKGLTYNVFYEAGPEFQANSYVIIKDCTPTEFNGNFKVLQSTPESVTFRKETTIEVLSSDPVSFSKERVWYNSTTKLYKHAKFDSTGTLTIDTYNTKDDLKASVLIVESVPVKSFITKPGIISGFGNATVKQLQGISLYSEPIIITQPRYGYARLTTDRQSIAYVPNVNYKGFDTFSWSMINQRGQIGTPKCVQINILDF